MCVCASAQAVNSFMISATKYIACVDIHNQAQFHFQTKVHASLITPYIPPGCATKITNPVSFGFNKIWLQCAL